MAWHLHYHEKKSPIFFSGRMAFFQIFCFQKPLRCYKNDTIICTRVAKKHCGGWKKSWLCLPRSVKQENFGAFLHPEASFFFEKFHRNDFLGLIETNLLVAKYLSAELWTLINCFLSFVGSDNMGKGWPMYFTTERLAFFSKTFVFNNILGVTEMILYIPE